MPDSAARRSVPGPIWRALQVALAALLGSAILIVGLTRTQVGRDGIRSQIERAVSERVRGTLTIESLTGSIIDDLVATGVRLKAPSGNVVATVDSIVAEPRWANLLTSELSVQSLLLIRPSLSPTRDSSGRWNLATALQAALPNDETRSPLDLSFAQVSVRDGRIEPKRSGAIPPLVRNGWAFDYTRSEISEISLRAAIERTGANARIVVQDASFSIPDPDVRVSAMQGRVVRETDGWSIDNLDVSLDTTRIRGQGRYRSPRPQSAPASFSLRLERSRLDHDELRRLVPRLPFRDLAVVEGDLQSSGDRLVLSEFEISHNASFATFHGTVSRAPPTTQLEVSVTESRMRLSDVREVWPALPLLPNSAVGPVDLTGRVDGTAELGRNPRTFDLDGTLRAASRHGAVRGSLAVRRAAGDSIRYSASLEADSLDVAPFIRPAQRSTQFSGTVGVTGVGLPTRSGHGTVDLSVAPLRIGARTFASADGEVTFRDGAIDGGLTIRQPAGGRLHVKMGLDSLASGSDYTLVASARNYDLAADGGPFPSTQLNARLALQGSGANWRDLDATAVLNVDSSTVGRGDSTTLLPPHSTTLRLSDRKADRPRVELSGSIATATIDGTTLGPRLWSSSQIWVESLRQAFVREMDKPISSDPGGPLPPFVADGGNSPLPSPRTFPPEFARETDAPPPIETSAQIRIHRSDILRVWWPTFPKRSEQFEVDASLSISPDSVSASGSISAGRLEFQSDVVTGLTAEYEIRGHNRAPLAQSLETEVQASADSLRIRDLPLSGASTSIAYTARAGSLRVYADSAGIIGPVELESDLNVTPTENEFRIRTASVGLRGDAWEIESPSSLMISSEGLAVTPLTLNRPHPQTNATQRIRIGGTLSGASADTLSLETENVAVAPFSRALGSPKLLGGDLGGQVHLTTTESGTALDGSLAVRRLSFDRRVLGDATLGIEYSTQSPDLRVGGSLRSGVTTVDSLSGPALVPSGVRTVEPNELSVSGRIRLPRWAYADASARSSQIPGEDIFDLNVDVSRADLFFFRYIFEERVAGVQGYTAGTIHVGGRYEHPIFDANLTVENGRVRLPRFGLQYEFSGPVDVDRLGIHLRDLSVRDDDGSATMAGSILFNEYQFFSFDLAATLDGITVIDVSRAEDLPFYGHIRASGPATLTGPLPDASLRSNAAETTPDSELFIPVSGETVENGEGFIVFADSTGMVPDLKTMTRRENILADRPEGQPTFVDGLNIDLNVTAPEGSTVNLVFDPVVGDVVTAVGSGRVQLQRQEGDFRVFGNFNATSGTYLFTAGEVFVRRFTISEGTITWDGDPIDAQLDLAAEYRTRASPSGLPGYENYGGRIPVSVKLDIAGRVATPRVDLSLALTRDEQSNLVGSETLDAILNEPALRTEYATSVLLTNTFLLTTESIMRRGGTGAEGTDNRLSAAGNQLAFNSVSQLVSSQLNRYLGAALPNVDLNFGVQGEDPNDLDLIYGVALRLLNERLVIRGEGVYTGDEPDAEQARGPEGEFVVEVRLSSNVSAKVFYRRTGDELTRNQALTSSRGAGLSFRTVFSTWADLFGHLFGWLLPDRDNPPGNGDSDPVAQPPSPASDSTRAANRPESGGIE